MPEPAPLTPLFLLDDEPIGSHRDSAFVDDPFARTVARAALGTMGPFTIGVYGGWGSGKTSALHAARTLIDTAPQWSHVVTVEFNAWRFEREEHPIVPLVATIEREVAKKAEALAQSAKASDKKAAADREAQVSWYQAAGMHCRAFLAGWQFKLKPEIGIPLVAKLGAEVNWNPKDSLQRYAELQKELKTLDGEHWSALRESCLSLSVFDALTSVGDAVQRAAGETRANWPLIVVFIDDLDRCQADKAFELLENVKLVLCQPGFVFVLALNHAVVDGYLTYRAEKLYGKDNVRLHRSYLEKIVQLPLTMPSRSERMAGFADHLLEARLSKAADPDLRAGLKGLTKVLALSANRTPRSLVRRINTALIDIALRDPAALPASLKSERSPFPLFSGLCIVQRTLESALGPEMTRAIAEDNALCEVIAKDNIWGINASSAGGAAEPGKEGTVAVQASGESDRRARMKDGWPRVFDAIWSDPANNFLWRDEPDEAGEGVPGTCIFTSVEGRRWLREHAERRAIMRISVQRPQSDGAVPESEPKADKVPTLTPMRQPWLYLHEGVLINVPVKERAVIEDATRRALRLAADAPLGLNAWGRLTELDLSGSVITDAGVAWLVRANNGLGALTRLDLSRTRVTDTAVKALAAPRTGLRSLTSLNLSSTRVGDEGVKALAAPHTAVKALSVLHLGDTRVTDEGVKALAAPTTGVKDLSMLHLSGTRVTDESVKALAAQQTGVKNLGALILSRTEVTDRGVDALVTPQSGLTALSLAYVEGSRVTAAGVSALRKRRPHIATH